MIFQVYIYLFYLQIHSPDGQSANDSAEASELFKTEINLGSSSLFTISSTLLSNLGDEVFNEENIQVNMSPTSDCEGQKKKRLKGFLNIMRKR